VLKLKADATEAIKRSGLDPNKEWRQHPEEVVNKACNYLLELEKNKVPKWPTFKAAKNNLAVKKLVKVLFQSKRTKVLEEWRLAKARQVSERASGE
jgi:hypothetical protein